MIYSWSIILCITTLGFQLWVSTLFSLCCFHPCYRLYTNELTRDYHLSRRYNRSGTHTLSVRAATQLASTGRKEEFD